MGFSIVGPAGEKDQVAGVDDVSPENHAFPGYSVTVSLHRRAVAEDLEVVVYGSESWKRLVQNCSNPGDVDADTAVRISGYGPG